MKSYIGTKIIQAEPMARVDFFEKIKNVPCDGENAHGYHVIYEDGYESWSPKTVFERSYWEIVESEKALIM